MSQNDVNVSDKTANISKATNQAKTMTALEVLNVAAERLSIVRYVFLVQIEDGIASASQRSSLEYADAVLMGWPDGDENDVILPADEQLEKVRSYVEKMEEYIASFSDLERAAEVDDMANMLVKITECVAEIRSTYQSDFPLPTFAEIRRVVQDEWDEEIGNINPDSANDAVSLVDETQAEDKAESDAS